MPGLSNLVPFHSGQVKKFPFTCPGKVNAILYYELTMPCCMGYSVDPDLQKPADLDLYCFQLHFLNALSVLWDK